MVGEDLIGLNIIVAGLVAYGLGGLAIAFFESYDKAMDWYKHDACILYSELMDRMGVGDVIAMLITLAPGIAMAYVIMNHAVLMNTMPLVVIWVPIVGFPLLIIFLTIDPPFTGIAFSNDIILIAIAVGYALFKVNAIAAIALAIFIGLIGIGMLTHYIDVALCSERD